MGSRSISLVLFMVLAVVGVVYSGTENAEGTATSSSLTPGTHLCTNDCLSSTMVEALESECPDINRQILKGHHPAGNISAGEYTPVKEATTIELCAQQCCKKSECNFVFYVNTTCYLLFCNNGPESCVPQPMGASEQEGIKTNISMVLVRKPKGMISPKNCEVGVLDCGDKQECVSVNSRSRNGICKCSEGFTYDTSGNCVPGQDEEGGTTNSPSLLQQSSTVKSIKILQVLVESKNVTLPENEVTLLAETVPPDSEDNPYSYEWTLISHPTEDGKKTATTSEGQASRKLRLLGLKQGTYIFQVSVRSPEANGSANATVLVSPANRINIPPVAVISPPEQNVQLPTASVVLDASSSTDDDKIVSYKWELQKGPIEFAFNPKKNLNSTTLQIENLIPGNYTFKLTVEDADHAVNSTTANIAVIKETDYPPTANAGQDIVIYLPQTEVTLNGNASTDDKKIAQWEWKATGDLNKAVDMQDTHTPYLKLSHLQEGFFTFELKVTDEGGLSSTSTVHVVVKPASGNPPKANAGIDQVLALPTNWAVLDASGSKSDNKIVKWNWTQISGPTNSTILDSDQIRCNVTSLTKGDYEFQVEIEDESKLPGKDIVKISVMQKINEPPRANAGGDKTVILPLTLVKLDGSKSKDDVKIAEWKWERDSNSLAAGVILGDSDKTPILLLTDVVAGKYVFKLTVKDEQGLSNNDTVTLTVQEDVRNKDLLEIIMGVPIYSFTESDKEKIRQQMTLLLHDTRLEIDRMRFQINTDYAILILHGISSKDEKIIEGTQLASQLRQRLHQDDGLLQFPIVSIDTVECLDRCSGHGVCRDTPNGRQCVCGAFWMENFLKIRLGNGDRNCEWSKIYVGVVTCFLLMMVFALLWSLVFLFRRNLGNLKENLSSSSSGSSNGASRSGKRYHSHKKQYTLLDDDEIEMELKADEGEADESEDSDSDILFETKRPKGKNGILKNLPSSTANGSLRNGILKQSRRIKT